MVFSRSLALLVVLALGPASTFSGAEDKDAATAFEFRQVKYFHRWSDKNQHEYTPDKQEDLDHWTDMITINKYPDVHDGDGLAAAANAVLGNYKSHDGKILRTNSIPQTGDRPAEHFIAVMFSQPALVEIAFARFKLEDDQGQSAVYSHRFYGEGKGDEASSWVKANGGTVEKALMEWDARP